MKFLIILLLLFLLSCNSGNDGTPTRQSNVYVTVDSEGMVNNSGDDAKVRIICIDGVEYLIFRGWRAGYFSGHFKPDGTLFQCDEE